MIDATASILNSINQQGHSIKAGILKTLIYFDIFSYPLTKYELIKFHQRPILDQADFDQCIADLISTGILFKRGDFYLLHDNSKAVDKRAEGNKLALQKMPIAKKYASIIARFPFVRAVLISGSLSKNYMEADSDVDFFIVTAPNRLWLLRTMLGVFRRVFLLNSHRYFCTNYLVDDQTLRIEEKNFFTAIELSTLIPVYGEHYSSKLRVMNNWTAKYLPNLTENKADLIKFKDSKTKRFLEWLLHFPLFDKLDTLSMNFNLARWRKKFAAQLDAKDFNIAFKTHKGVSKSHPKFLQKKILTLYYQRLKFFESRVNISLTDQV
jgi:hypothetical protein